MEISKELLKQNKSFKIIIPSNIEEKINYTCKHISEVEWSGTLFYTSEGSYDNDNIVVTVKDFYLQDKGNKTFTSFEPSPDMVGYMVDNDLINCQRGLIHSHNSMNTFFSGTDTSTLISEGVEFPHFVSLIVNNTGEYTAGITTKNLIINKVNQEYYKLSFNNEHTLYKTAVFDEEIVSIEWSDMEIEVQGRNVELDKELKERIKEIEKNKKSDFNKISFNEPGSQHSLYTTVFEEKDFNNPYQKDIEYITKCILLGTISLEYPDISIDACIRRVDERWGELSISLVSYIVDALIEGLYTKLNNNEEDEAIFYHNVSSSIIKLLPDSNNKYLKEIKNCLMNYTLD